MHFRVSSAKLDAWETTGKNKDTGTDLMKFPNASVLTLLSLSRKRIRYLRYRRSFKEGSRGCHGGIWRDLTSYEATGGLSGDAVRNQEESLSRRSSSTVRAQGTAGGAGEVPGRVRKQPLGAANKA